MSNDVTAIDAVTGDAANMAADSTSNFGNLDENAGERAGAIPVRAKPSPRPARPKPSEPRPSRRPTPSPTPNSSGAGRRPCAPAGSGAISAAPSPAGSPPRRPPSRSSQSIGWTRKWSNAQRSSSAGSIPSCGHTSFSSSPERWTTSVPAFGLTQIQSMPGVAGKVPLVSTATRKPRPCSASTSARVELEHRLAAGDHHQPLVFALAPQLLDLRRRAPPPRRTCRRPRRPCRRNRCRRSGIARRRGPPRAPTTGCSRQSAGTPPGSPPAPPRPAASGSIP